MRIKRLKLTGFAGIRAGRGRDEIDIDFERLVGDAELVAITGPNGAGKSTIMDNLTPYRLMPSRTKTMTPAGFSYYDHLSAPTALKELEWEHEGRRYRSSLTFSVSGRKRKQDAYLHVRDEKGTWVPAVVDGIESRGNTDTYDTIVAKLLGDPEVFCTSQFRAQGARPLSAYANSEIKTLMSGLLGHDPILAMGERAGQVVRLLRAGLDTLRTTLGAMATLESSLPAIEAEAVTAQRRVVDAAQTLEQKRPAVATAQTALATAQAEAAAHAEVEIRRKRLEQQLRETQTKSDSALATAVRDIQTAETRVERLRKQIADEGRQTAENRSKIEAEGKKQKALIERRAEIEAAVKTLDTLRAKAQTLTAKAQSERAVAEQIQQLTHHKAVLTGTLQGIQHDRASQCRHRDTLAQQAGLVNEVPCRGTPMQQTCPLLREAVQAGRAIATIDTALVRLDETTTARKAEQAQADQELARLAATTGARSAAQDLERLNAEIAKTQQVAALATALEMADSSLKAMRDQWRALADAATIRGNALQGDLAVAQKTVEDMKARKLALETELKNQADALRSEIARLPASDSAAAVRAAESALAAATEMLARSEADLDAARKAEATANAAVEAARAEWSAGVKTRERATRIEAEIGYWSLLHQSMGHNGIIALSIDDAGPDLARLANDLLASCYGPRFTVSIQTQVTTAKGETREGFEIMVYDADAGTSKPIDLTSGGERVWINEAITRAIALYLAQSSGCHYETLFSDEADGALDLEHKRRFMAMKRRVLQLGGYKQEFFVSQTPELWGMADATIDLDTIARTDATAERAA